MGFIVSKLFNPFFSGGSSETGPSPPAVSIEAPIWWRTSWNFLLASVANTLHK